MWLFNADFLFNLLRAGDGKVEIRHKVWDYLEDNHLALFPRPPHRRISNFRVSVLHHSLLVVYICRYL